MRWLPATKQRVSKKNKKKFDESIHDEEERGT